MAVQLWSFAVRDKVAVALYVISERVHGVSFDGIAMRGAVERALHGAGIAGFQRSICLHACARVRVCGCVHRDGVCDTCRGPVIFHRP
jgi:hypothetical protein